MTWRSSAKPTRHFASTLGADGGRVVVDAHDGLQVLAVTRVDETHRLAMVHIHAHGEDAPRIGLHVPPDLAAA
jgi:hypothetical protein